MFPCLFVAGADFSMHNYILRAYPGRLLSEDQQTFNARLSSVKQVIKSTFGLLVSR
uniref:DDE Tnp4 domain-containing protein n=1 Tax=Glossina morsitans morsitans TaxID=37546 RepID=A0ABK9NG92_GLOMM